MKEASAFLEPTCSEHAPDNMSEGCIGSSHTESLAYHPAWPSASAQNDQSHTHDMALGHPHMYVDYLV